MAPHIKIASALALVVLVLANGVRGARVNVLTELAKMPKCGMECFTNSLNGSSCSFTDITCICTDESFHTKAEDCVISKCSIAEGMEIARIEAKACSRPERSRKALLLVPLIVELPAFFCPWIRLYSRWLTAGKWDLDDWLMVVVGALYSVFLGIGQYTGQLAFGVDIWTLSTETLVEALKLFYIDESFYLTALGLCKVSVLCLYLRIFPNRRFRWAVFATMGLTIIPNLVLVCMQILQCVPIHYVWQGWLVSGNAHCLDAHILIYTAAGFSILQDVVILILPLPLLTQLKVDIRAKCGIIAMFSLGIFGTMTSCIRLRYIAVFHRTTNPTWDYVDVLIWTGLEVAVALIVACMPSIGMLMRRLVPWFMTSIRTTSAPEKVKSKSTARTFECKGKAPKATGFLEGNRRGSNSSEIELGLAVPLEDATQEEDVQRTDFAPTIAQHTASRVDAEARGYGESFSTVGSCKLVTATSSYTVIGSSSTAVSPVSPQSKAEKMLGLAFLAGTRKENNWKALDGAYQLQRLERDVSDLYCRKGV